MYCTNVSSAVIVTKAVSWTVLLFWHLQSNHEEQRKYTSLQKNIYEIRAVNLSGNALKLRAVIVVNKTNHRRPFLQIIDAFFTIGPNALSSR